MILNAVACNSSESGDVDAKIQAVENNLKLPFTIKGDPGSGLTISERMKHHKVPGVSVAVIDGGQIVWAKGYGTKEAGGDDPVTPETLFQAASISKPVSAMGALRLVEKGMLALDDPVNDKLQSWHVPVNEFTEKEKVTLRRLLTHSAGLTVHGFPGYAASKDIPTIIQVLDGEKPANTPPVRVDMPPGSEWRYSGGGYTVMQLLVSDITGKPFDEYMKKTVLDPIGMKNSTFEQPLPAEKAVLAASAHRPTGKMIPGKWHIYPELAAAGLWTTPSDLCRYAVEVQKSLGGKSNKVLSQNMIRQMLTPGIGNWGLGPAISPPGQVKMFSHGGGNDGFRCQLVAFSELGMGAAVMTNSDNGSELAMEIIRGIAEVYDWPYFRPEEIVPITLDPGILDAYIGDFRMASAPGIPFKVSVKEGELYVTILGKGNVSLTPVSETEFVYLEGGWRLTFVKKPDGSCDEIKVGQVHSSMDMRLLRKK
ncbi:MAG: beta-lactamase family protein [Candidatus Aminicenantes bacterium]|nr:beta-lactamase family protein [Candidatus Aminicenantes bacterium]